MEEAGNVVQVGACDYAGKARRLPWITFVRGDSLIGTAHDGKQDV